MLTPIDVERKVFKSGIGYDKKDVDTFLSEICDSFEKTYKENMEMQKKIEVLNNGLQHYKVIEKSLQKALVLAQRAAEETKETAKTSAQMIEADARTKAKSIVADAQNELISIQNKTQALLTQYDLYKAQYKQLARTQLELLKNGSFDIKAATITDINSTSKLPNEEEAKKE